MLIWKIAWRNVWRHTGKSLVIGMILGVGAFLMTMGNAVVNGSKQGLQQNAVERFTGHLTLINEHEDAQSIFFTESIVPLKVLPNYPELKTILESQDIIERFIPMSRGFAVILSEFGGNNADPEPGENTTFLFGVEFEHYQEIFEQNVVAVEGALLEEGDHGVLITEKDRLKIYDQHGIWVVPQGRTVDETVLPAEAREAGDRLVVQDELVFLGLSGENMESDIRVPVKGIVRFRSLNKVWSGSFMDIESFRQCFGYLSTAAADVELSDEKAAFLTLDDELDLFAEDDDLIGDMGMEAVEYNVAAMQQQTEREDSAMQTEHGAYQFVALKLKPDIALEDGIARLQQVFADAGMNVKILTWKQATGSVAQFAGLVQGVLTMFVLFTFFVAAIVITNTLSMAAMERTSEIGMMRAIGSQKRFISLMFLAEIAILSIIFGGAGMLTGVVVTAGLNALQFPTDGHEMISLLAGSDVLHPIVDVTGFLIGSGQLAVVTLLAVLYPILVARKITPLEAIARD